MSVVSMLWRRLDTPGHDACRLGQTNAGWTLDGAAVFLHDGSAARLTYQLECDHTWRILRGRVHGWLGRISVEYVVRRSGLSVWTLNDDVVAGLEECLDLDLGFTPATNVLQIRRLNLAEGQGAAAPVAWLDVATGTLELLRQHYERRTVGTYWYEAPRFDYRALLEVTPAGFVRLYPGLWEAER